MPVDFDATVNKEVQDAFAIQVRFTTAEAGVFDKRGVFDNEHEMVEMDPTPQSTTAPTLTIRLSEYATIPKQRDTFEILEGDFKGNQYVIVDDQEDSEGFLILIAELKRP